MRQRSWIDQKRQPSHAPHELDGEFLSPSAAAQLVDYFTILYQECRKPGKEKTREED